MQGDGQDIDLAELQAFLGKHALSTSAALNVPTHPPGLGGDDGPKDGWGEWPKEDGLQEEGLQEEAEATVVTFNDEEPVAAYLGTASWEDLGLPEPVLNGILEMGFVKPSKIQEWALPIALEGGNIIGQARNGSGKTAAFALAMLLRVDESKSWPQGLCVCPTRELATQNHDVIKALGKFTSVEYFLAVPKGPKDASAATSQVVVGTPGKVQELLKKNIVDPRWMTIFVLDEADVVIDEGNQMGPQVAQIKKMLPYEVQVLLFSATFPERVEEFAKAMVWKPQRIAVTKADLTLETINQTFIDVGNDPAMKQKQLSELYGALNIGQSVVFVNSRNTAFELAKHMKADGHSVSLICGTQKQGVERIDERQRDKIVDEFRTGVTKVLIATNVLSRGIDVPAVTLVVNYDIPVNFHSQSSPDYETYVHRIGRTGRFGLKGIAVNLVTSRERPLLSSIEDFYKCSMKELSGDCEEMEELLRDLR